MRNDLMRGGGLTVSGDYTRSGGSMVESVSENSSEEGVIKPSSKSHHSTVILMFPISIVSTTPGTVVKLAGGGSVAHGKTWLRIWQEKQG